MKVETRDLGWQAGPRAIVVPAGGRLLPALRECGGEHVTLDIGRKSPAVLRHVPALRALLLREAADIVHARSRLPAWLGRIALHSLPARRRPRWVTTVHGLNSPGRYSSVMASGERVVCVSQTVREHVLRHYPAVEPARLWRRLTQIRCLMGRRETPRATGVRSGR